MKLVMGVDARTNKWLFNKIGGGSLEAIGFSHCLDGKTVVN